MEPQHCYNNGFPFNLDRGKITLEDLGHRIKPGRMADPPIANRATAPGTETPCINRTGNNATKTELAKCHRTGSQIRAVHCTGGYVANGRSDPASVRIISARHMGLRLLGL